jgi:hypothetical protein
MSFSFTFSGESQKKKGSGGRNGDLAEIDGWGKGI